MTLMVLFLICPAMAIAAPVGTFTVVKGTVTLTPAGKTPVSVHKGDPVSVGDSIYAGNDSIAEITFVNESIVRVAPQSRVAINEYVFEEDTQTTKSVVKLWGGKIQSIINTSKGWFGKGNRFEVHTPTAVCGVRGCNFNSSQIAGIAAFAFIEGEGFVYTPDNPNQLFPTVTGQTTTVEDGDVTTGESAEGDLEPVLTQLRGLQD